MGVMKTTTALSRGKFVMPKVFPQLTAWSFSLHRRYAGCPRQCALDKLLKVKMQNTGMARGTDIHSAAEDFLNAKVKKLPEPLLLVADHAKALKKDKNTQPELQMTFTRQWAPTGWFDDDAWCRIKVDARRVLEATRLKVKIVEITDWKSGRPYAHWDTQQAELYALGEFCFSGAEEVRTTFQHTDSGEITEGVFLIAEVKSLKKVWEGRVKKMLNDKLFPATPGRQCAWCPHSKKKGGVCDVG